MTLSEVLTYMFPGIDFRRECILRDDGSGPSIVTWTRPEPIPTEAQISAATLPAAKQAKLAKVRAEAKSHIYNLYPDWRQQNACLGLLAPAYVLTMQQFISNTINASNIAEDQVDAATTEAQVNAVTPIWP